MLGLDDIMEKTVQAKETEGFKSDDLTAGSCKI